MTKQIEHLRRRVIRSGPCILNFTAMACGLALTCGLLLQEVATVTVTDTQGPDYQIMTAIDDTDTLIEMLNITLDDEDHAHFTRSGTDADLLVTRAFPVTVYADGKKYTTMFSVGSIQEAVQKTGVTLDENDFTEPALDASVTQDMSFITVHRVVYEDVITQEPVPFETEYTERVDDPDGKYTHNIVVSEGIEGVQEITTRTTYVDGKETGTQVIDTCITQAPQNEVHLTLQDNVVSPLLAPEGITVENGVPSSYSQVYTMKATGYYSARGRGASGLGLYYGTFAVDPTLIPYGTKVYIVSTNGKFVYGWAIATDTGAFIHSNRMQVDLFYETYAESAANGAKQVYVYVP